MFQKKYKQSEEKQNLIVLLMQSFFFPAYIIWHVVRKLCQKKKEENILKFKWVPFQKLNIGFLGWL